MIKMTCIMCPMGCQLEVEKDVENFKVSGNNCIRGERYAKTELTNPTRMVTSLVKTKEGVVPVKTTDLVPKDKIKDVLIEISKLNLNSTKYGEIVIKNVCGLSGVDVIVTR